MNRRGFLAVLSRAPVVGVIGAKVAADQAASALSGLNATGLPVGGERAGGLCAPAAHNIAEPNLQQRLLAMRIPAVRRDIESLLYEQERRICAIDPDIAGMRSFSLAAKIAYQRQRNVERELRGFAIEWKPTYRRIHDAVFRALGLSIGSA